jgi:mannose-6-phosphate isomerase-like protein (cupin superfamily)
MSTYVMDTERAERVHIRGMALTNDAFRRVVHTGAHEQIVVMTLRAKEAIGAEVHPDTDQLFIIVEGSGEAKVGDHWLEVIPGDLLFVEAGTRHDIVNRSAAPLRLITVYSPPEHAPGTVHETKAEAEAAER